MNRPARADDFECWEAESRGLIFEQDVGDSQFCGYGGKIVKGSHIVLGKLLVEGFDFGIIGRTVWGRGCVGVEEDPWTGVFFLVGEVKDFVGRHC